MDDSDYPELFELFDWSNREKTYRVLFMDGDEYDLKGVLAGKDIGEPPHGDGLIVECRHGGVSTGALFFRLGHVTKVQDASTGEVLWSAA